MAARPHRASLARVAPERLLVWVVLALVSFGVVMVYSASSATTLLEDGNPLIPAVRQVAFAALGLIILLVLLRVRPAALRHLAPLALAGSVFLLLVVLIPSIGTTINGSRRWIEFGPFGQVQPSELAKLALVLWLAQAIARDPRAVLRKGGMIPFGAVTGVVAGLILLEPDLGTTTLILMIAGSVLLVAGAPVRKLGAAAGLVALLGLVAIMSADYRRERLLAFLDPWSDPGGAGFQSVQAQVALGSGGIQGVGLGDGLQKVFYLPEAHTDMILATIGEELGLIGVSAVLAAFALFAIAGYRIAMRARDLHLQLVAAGLTTMVVSQAAVNVGAVVGVMPVTGVPLPFVSAGGTSLVVLLASTGILVNIGRRTTDGGHAVRRIPEGAPGRDRGRGHGRPRDAGARGGRRAVRSGRAG